MWYGTLYCTPEKNERQNQVESWEKAKETYILYLRLRFSSVPLAAFTLFTTHDFHDCQRNHAWKPTSLKQPDSGTAVPSRSNQITVVLIFGSNKHMNLFVGANI